MKSKDYYKILGVDKSARIEEIKKRYRELAKKHHPDANKGSKKSEELFKAISQAYETLKDKKKRKAYDQRFNGDHARTHTYSERGGADETHREPYRQGHGRSGPYGKPREEAPNFDTPTRGFDLQFIIDVPLVTVLLGGKTPYSYEKYINCPDCEGTGSISGKKCNACLGKRQVVAPVKVDVEIPAGVADQFTLRLENQGCEGRNGGPPGDLLLKINTLPHPRFKRMRNDVIAKVGISPKLAREGGTQTVETLDATRTIPVEEGTLTGEEYRLPGAGAVSLCENKRGDFIIKFFITDN